MYTIKRAAELLGVSEATLRAWERRYGIGSPTRSDAGYRLYDDAALSELMVMHALVRSGWSAREAATQTLRRKTDPQTAPDAASTAAQVELLADSAVTFDTTQLGTLLDERFASGPFETVIDSWLLPALAALGQGWEAQRLTVAGEHFVSHAVTRRLSAAYDSAGENPHGPKVVIGLPPGARHDLGLLSFATAARRVGLSTRYLGADVPVSDWAVAVADTGVRAAVLAAPMAEDGPALTQVVEAVLAARPDLVVAVGGAAQELAPSACMLLGHSVSRAAAELAGRLSRTHTAL